MKSNFTKMKLDFKSYYVTICSLLCLLLIVHWIKNIEFIHCAFYTHSQLCMWCHSSVFFVQCVQNVLWKKISPCANAENRLQCHFTKTKSDFIIDFLKSVISWRGCYSLIFFQWSFGDFFIAWYSFFSCFSSLSDTMRLSPHCIIFFSFHIIVTVLHTPSTMS